MQRIIRLTGLVLIDAFLINLSYILAYLLRFDFVTDTTLFGTSFELYINFWVALTLIKLVVFFACGLYSSLWRYAGAQELLRVLVAAISANLATSLLLIVVGQGIQRSLAILPLVFDMLLVGGIRLFYRFAIGFKGQKTLMSGASGPVNRVMLVGSGYAAAAIIKEIRLHTTDMLTVPVVAVDENKNKVGNRISGIKIAGTKKDIPRLARRYKVDEIFIALPSANKKELQAIMSECNKTSCKVKLLPAMHELIGGKVSVSRLRNIDIEDLIGRETVEVNIKEIGAYLKGRIVLVTGAGGTIGAEICRQVGKYLPRKIIALDICETGIFELNFELRRLYPEVEVETVICSVTEKEDIKLVFEKNKPHVVFHAASQKNSQLMATNMRQAVRNNVFGALSLINACEEYAAGKFILISSDKATRPRGIAGAVARTSEMLVQIKATTSKTQYLVVRLGSILGSDGTVVPLFKKQIEQGWPVTVTHPDALRHFMPLQASVQLILQAAALAQGGEIFTLEMGKSIRIMDLAENMIKLYGYKPQEEIPITVIGLRPGEKIYEEFIPDKRYLKPTNHGKIFIIGAETLDADDIEQKISLLWNCVRHEDERFVKQALGNLIPEYTAKS